MFRIAALSGWIRSFDPDTILSKSPVFLFWGGALLCAAFGASLVICRKLGWVIMQISPLRALWASVLIFFASFL
jgi:hypothetical protein